MSLLERIHRGKQPAPRRVLIYGTHGVGKSSAGAAAPNPIFLPTEDGLGEIDCESFPLMTTFADCLAAIGQLYTEPHEYQTLVVDSADWLERLIHADVCNKRGVKNIEDIGYGKGYSFALTQWREFLTGLDAIRKERSMHIVLLAHARIERFDNPETDSCQRYSPRLHQRASDLVSEWCDEVLFAAYKVFTKASDQGFGRNSVKGVATGERILRTTERPAHIAKNRLNLPDELPLDWNAYANHFQKN